MRYLSFQDMFFRKKNNEKSKEPKPWHYAVLLGIVAISFVVWMFQDKMDVVTLEVKDERLQVLVASTFQQQYRGLGGRESLGEYDGMLFPFGYEGRHAIVMRDMRFPIDIVWLRYNEVVDIAPMVPIEPDESEHALFRYTPRTDATTVLELEAGRASELGLRIGDTVRLIENESVL